MSKRRKAPNRKHKGPRAQPPKRLGVISKSTLVLQAATNDFAFGEFVEHCLTHHEAAFGDPGPRASDDAVTWHPIPDLFRHTPKLGHGCADGIVIASRCTPRWRMTALMFDFEFAQAEGELA